MEKQSSSDNATTRDGANTAQSNASSDAGIPMLVRGEPCDVIFRPATGVQYCRTTSPPRPAAVDVAKIVMPQPKNRPAQQQMRSGASAFTSMVGK